MMVFYDFLTSAMVLIHTYISNSQIFNFPLIDREVFKCICSNVIIGKPLRFGDQKKFDFFFIFDYTPTMLISDENNTIFVQLLH